MQALDLSRKKTFFWKILPDGPGTKFREMPRKSLPPGRRTVSDPGLTIPGFALRCIGVVLGRSPGSNVPSLRGRIGPLFYLKKDGPRRERGDGVPCRRRYLGSANRAVRREIEALPDGAGVIEQQQDRGAPHEIDDLEGFRRRMPLRADIGAGLDGVQQSLDRVVQTAMQIEVRPPAG